MRKDLQYLFDEIVKTQRNLGSSWNDARDYALRICNEKQEGFIPAKTEEE